jgi:hypothetical protein
VDGAGVASCHRRNPKDSPERVLPGNGLVVDPANAHTSRSIDGIAKRVSKSFSEPEEELTTCTPEANARREWRGVPMDFIEEM